MKTILTGIWGSITAFIISLVYEQVFLKTLGWPQSAALILAAGLGIFLLAIYELVIHSKFMIRLLSPISSIEGAWQITLSNNPTRPSSICRIYLSKEGTFVYKGFGITDKGELGSQWISRDVHYDDIYDELSFTADATISPIGTRIRNYGYITFSRNVDGTYDHGDGYFVDMGENTAQLHMKLSRITDEEFERRSRSLIRAVTVPIKNLQTA